MDERVGLIEVIEHEDGWRVYLNHDPAELCSCGDWGVGCGDLVVYFDTKVAADYFAARLRFRPGVYGSVGAHFRFECPCLALISPDCLFGQTLEQAHVRDS